MFAIPSLPAFTARPSFTLGSRILTSLWIVPSLCASLLGAQIPASVRSPLGVYAKVDVQIAIGRYSGPASQLHSYLRGLYASLLADPAISGLTIGDHWGNLQPSSGASASSFDWTDLDDAFSAAAAAQKSVQLILTPGTDMPTWLVNQISSCDPLFTSGGAPANCGTVTFVGYPEVQRADQTMFPLPWNTVYQAAWNAFLVQLNARYGSNPTLVAVAIAGPVGASDEMIFPTSANTKVAQPSGLAVDVTWAALIQHSFPTNSAYQNTDQAFIDAWKQTIDAYEAIFSGVTLFLGPDAGDDFPNFSQTVTPHADNTLFAVDCSNSPKNEIMSCEAKTQVLSYFLTVAGPNGKGTQVGGMTASSPVTIGNIGVQGVKVLTALSPPPSPPLIGGAEFDIPVSGADLEQEGCSDASGNCPGLSAEEGAYNVLTVFFTGTPAAAFYGGTVGTAPMQYLEVSYLDVQYALSNACPAASSPWLGSASLQDLYARASRDIFAMANQIQSLPAPTCTNGTAGAAGTVLAPNRLNFKTQNPSQTGVAQPVRLWNNGTQALTISGIVASGDFHETDNCPASLPGGAECTIEVTFKPTAVGVRAGALTVTDSASASPQITSLSGIGGAPTLYVSTNGNDSWSGLLAEPDAAHTDGPFATLDRARAIVRTFKLAGVPRVDVQIRGGTYYLPSTVQFAAADSGSASTEIVYQNYREEQPVFSGGVRVTNWTNVGANKWQTTLPASTQFFENLFYNGTRRLRPRLGGYLGTYYRILNTVYLNAPAPPAAAPNANCSVYIVGSGWQCFDRFQYFPNDPLGTISKNMVPATGNPCGQSPGNQAIAGDVELMVWEQFSTSKLRISCVDTASHIAYMTGPTGISQVNASEEGFIAGNRYLVENVADALSQPGQWFLDRSATPWTLTYLSNPGEDPNADTVMIPQLAQDLVAMNLQYVTFRGLTFEHDNYTLPPLGHISSELEPDIPAAVSFQNSQHITFDSGVVRETSGTGLEFIPCLNASSPAYCAVTSVNAAVSNILIENSAFYDIGVEGVRIGNPFQAADTDANVPQQVLVQNNVVEGYGRIVPAAFGIGQGMGHDNLYTHNDVYDGYHCAISTSQSIGHSTMPSGIGNANTTISFNHVWNLLQGVMNDGGSIRIDSGNGVFTAAGNRILNNKIHDVTDASIIDSNGYGGHGIYMDDSTGLVDVENNLVYRVSGAAIHSPHGPNLPGKPNIIKNNILAFAQTAMINTTFPYYDGVPSAPHQEFEVSNNLMIFDHSSASAIPFSVQGGCTYAAGFPYTSFQQFASNLYWRTDGGFAADPQAFHAQTSPATNTNDAPCSTVANSNKYTYFSFSQWQQNFAEDLQSVVQNPGFKNPAYPNDDFSLPSGSPGLGFVPFDPTQAGRTTPEIQPPAIPATFPTQMFNPATDY